MTFYIKQHDTSPAILATLSDATGAAIDLTDATIRFHMRPIGKTTVVVDAAASIVTAATGDIRYDWIGADTATIGSFQAEFEVTFPDSSIETFPNDSYVRIEIINDIA